MFLKCDADFAMKIIEEFLRQRSIEFEKKEFRTEIGLRKVEYKLKNGRITMIVYLNGVEVKLPRNLKELKKILEAYKAEYGEIKKDEYDLKVERQIYKAKFKLALRGAAIRSTILLVTAAMIPLNESTLTFLFTIALVLFLIPEREKYFDLSEPSQWAIPLLIPYYARKAGKL